MLMFQVLQKFNIFDDVVEMERYGRGFINRTYYMKGKKNNYVFQVVERSLFKEPNNVMINIRNTVNHLQQKHQDHANYIDLKTNEGDYFLTLQNKIWHGFIVPKNARLYKKVVNSHMMTQIAKGLALFHYEFLDLDKNLIHESNTANHDYNKLYADLEKAVKLDTHERALKVFNEVKFVSERIKAMKDFSLLANKTLPQNIIHNNIRLNNILLDESTYNYCATIGYDAVSKGSLLYDIGDTIRHLVAVVREDETNLDLVKLNLDYFEAFIKGYLEIMKKHLTDLELANIIEACRVMTLEEGMRYLIDYLENDREFKIDYHSQNLDRLRNRFKLVQYIEKNYSTLESIIQTTIKELDNKEA